MTVLRLSFAFFNTVVQQLLIITLCVYPCTISLGLLPCSQPEHFQLLSTNITTVSSILQLQQVQSSLILNTLLHTKFVYM